MVTSIFRIFTTECVCFICLLTVVILSKGCFGEEQPKEKLINSVHLEGENVELSRASKKTSNQGFMTRILPLLIVPFLISSALIPGMLISIKFLLVKGLITGAIAVVIMLLNMFRARVNGGGVFNHYAPDLAKEHYGYEGFDEPGAYIPKKRRRR